MPKARPNARVQRKALVMSAKGRQVPSSVQTRYSSISFRTVPLIGGPQRTTVTIPAPPGYTTVSVAMASLGISAAPEQGGIPGARGVFAGVWIESATPSSVTVAFNAGFLDDTYQQIGEVYALLTFYFLN